MTHFWSLNIEGPKNFNICDHKGVQFRMSEKFSETISRPMLKLCKVGSGY